MHVRSRQPCRAWNLKMVCTFHHLPWRAICAVVPHKPYLLLNKEMGHLGSVMGNDEQLSQVNSAARDLPKQPRAADRVCPGQ